MTTQDDVKGPEQGCSEAPFTEQLRSVPKEFRAWYPIQWDEDGRETGHRHVPVGHMMHKAADLFDQAQRELAEVKRERDELQMASVLRTDTFDKLLEERDRYRGACEQAQSYLATHYSNSALVTLCEALHPQPTTPDSGGGGG